MILRQTFSNRTMMFLVCLFVSSVLVMGQDMGSDFQGFMEDKEKQEEIYAKHQEMLDKHEIWRQTTWGGWAVRQLQALGNHFRPFFIALSDILQGETEDSTAGILLTLLLRALVISAYIIAAYAAAKIINSILGREIVLEEEIIIEEDDEDEDEDEDKKEQ